MELDKNCQVFPTEQLADGLADCGNTQHAQLVVIQSNSINSVTSVAPKSSEIRAQRRRIQIETSSVSRVKA